jgi:hypothetical protein
MFPFDSGAYSQVIYAPFIGDEFRLEEFLLPPAVSTPPKVVGAIFGSNRNYLEGTIRPECSQEFDQLDFHSQIYADMNSSERATKFDCRWGIVEIQSVDPIPLAASTLEAIVVPDRLRTHREIEVLASDCDAELLSYRWRKDRASERAKDIDDIVMDWHQRRGVL